MGRFQNQRTRWAGDRYDLGLRVGPQELPRVRQVANVVRHPGKRNQVDNEALVRSPADDDVSDVE